MRTKQALAKQGAVDRMEPFWRRKQREAQRATAAALERDRAWNQSVVFLPRHVAARDPLMQRDRSAPDFNESIDEVKGLL